jgi:hypothetical protein
LRHISSYEKEDDRWMHPSIHPGSCLLLLLAAADLDLADRDLPAADLIVVPDGTLWGVGL